MKNSHQLSSFILQSRHRDDSDYVRPNADGLVVNKINQPIAAFFGFAGG
jgi:hypothetical protein